MSFHGAVAILGALIIWGMFLIDCTLRRIAKAIEKLERGGTGK